MCYHAHVLPMKIFDTIFGTPSTKAIKRYKPIVAKINALEQGLLALSDDELRQKTTEFKERLAKGETTAMLLPEAFAVVREVSRRLSGERHYDVQLMGGIALHEGNIAEMKTGEGKTLVATLPVYLNALVGDGVHVITVNDYLARRDAVWMGQIYSFLGLRVGIINGDGAYLYDATAKPEESNEDEVRDALGSFKVVHEYLRPASKKDAYHADITYGTNNEYGFDYLRDNIEYEPQALRQRGHHYAIVDEIDSILIDEARTPLIISSPAAESENLYQTFAEIARSLNEGEDFEKEEKSRSISITDKGIEKAEKMLGVTDIYTQKGIKYVHHLETAIRAKALYTKDKQYVVKDGQIVIVDEFTGRLQPGRRWSEGLHQAIEAKEGMPVQRESRTYASVTFQNYFRMYKKLAGMTGTAETSAEEFQTVYNLETIVIPTHRTISRIDKNDLIYKNENAKFSAVAKKVKEVNALGQPVLIGTVSIEKNELLSAYLHKEGVPHEVLNAKNHEREGEIIAQAGKKGNVTVATNMAGRGVDIKLGGVPATPEGREEVKALGGLFVLGTERHEARRIDNQLRGRSGRQGDPGETQFFVSLDDDLMRVFGNNELIRMVMDKLPEDEAITHGRISKSLETAQKRIEGFNFDSRKHVLAYDNVMNHQRQAIYKKRMIALLGSDAEVDELLISCSRDTEALTRILEGKKSELGAAMMYTQARRLIMRTIDTLWMDHLESMEYLRSSVNLRAYGQRDPLIEYRKEGLRLFKELEESIEEDIRNKLPTLAPSAMPIGQIKVQAIQPSTGTTSPVTDSTTEYGRNDLVTITDGVTTETVKYKKAEAKIAQGFRIIENK